MQKQHAEEESRVWGTEGLEYSYSVYSGPLNIPPPHPLYFATCLCIVHLANCTGNGECACRLRYPIKGREALNTYVSVYKCT